MSTKAEAQTLIDTDLASDQPITAVLHRNVLKDDEYSLLSNMYADEIIDTQITQTVFTPNQDCSFDLNILKQGRKVTISGTITANEADVVNAIDIIDSNFEVGLGKIYYGVGDWDITFRSGIYITNSSGTTTLKFNIPLPLGRIITFGFVYTTST
ncbi:MAG: hypothetical protein GY928_01920 [Colwellia sp.]|nr:hypothetical protein [Colwellia sp.]